ncbi:lactate racemase domain-containing protein [Myxococcota bacterium]|nr:lactate racemase domain-containing protein [Myxococcota bacterium]
MAPAPAGALEPFAPALAALTGTVAVCVPDLTRPLDPRPALRALQAVVPGRLRVVVGLGLHRPMTAEELAPLAPWSPAQSDPDDAVAYGQVDGVPGAVTRAVAQADHVLTIGIAELHQYAGVSGGHKGVVVGCGGRATIQALHHRDRVTDPRVRLGVLEGNPFRGAIDGLGEELGVALALNWLPQAGRWMAGPPPQVTAAAAAALDPWQPLAGEWSGAVLTVPAAKAGSFYQASRAATYLGLSPAPPLSPGATLVLHAACPEGLGAEAGFVAALQRCPPPWSELLTGPPPTGAGAQRAVMLALLATRYRLQIRGCHDPAPLRAVGLDASADPPPRGPAWLEVPAPFSRLPQRA